MTQKPATVQLTEDYLDLKVGIAYPKGTILERQCSGQYALPGTKLGGECIAYFALIRDICEAVE